MNVVKDHFKGLPENRLKANFQKLYPPQKKEKTMSRFNKLSHSLWFCKNHIVWTPKYRYRISKGEIKREVENCSRIPSLQNFASYGVGKKPTKKIIKKIHEKALIFLCSAIVATLGR